MRFAKGIRSDRFGMFFLLLLLASCAAASSENYNEILTNTNRPDAEKALDAVRKPQEVMAFYEVKTGQRVADIFASRGYYTAILSQLVGADGVVYSANPAPRQELHDRLKQPGMGNVRVLDGPFDKLALPQDGSLDFVLLHLDYHEIAADVRARDERANLSRRSNAAAVTVSLTIRPKKVPAIAKQKRCTEWTSY